jgi:hypothetical protein
MYALAAHNIASNKTHCMLVALRNAGNQHAEPGHLARHATHHNYAMRSSPLAALHQ